MSLVKISQQETQNFLKRNFRFTETWTRGKFRYGDIVTINTVKNYFGPMTRKKANCHKQGVIIARTKFCWSTPHRYVIQWSDNLFSAIMACYVTKIKS